MGRDSVDHPPGGHDDIANSVAGALVGVLEGELTGEALYRAIREGRNDFTNLF